MTYRIVGQLCTVRCSCAIVNLSGGGRAGQRRRAGQIFFFWGGGGVSFAYTENI